MSTAPHEPGPPQSPPECPPRGISAPLGGRRSRRSVVPRALGAAAAGALLLGAAALALGPGQGRAQDGGGSGAGGSLRLSLDVDSEIRAGRDVTVGDTRGDVLSRTDLSFGLRSETPTQSLFLSLGGTYRALPFEGDSEFTGPDGRLRYRREAADANLTVTGSVQTRDLDFVRGLLLDEDGEPLDFDQDGVILDDDGIIDADNLETGTGTRRATRLGFSLDLLQDRPIGVELDGSYRRIDFDEADTNFDESRRASLDAALRLRLAPTLTARLTYGISRFDSDRDAQDDPDDDVRRDTDSYGVAFDYDVTPRLNATLALRRTANDIEEVDGDEIDRAGVTGSAGLTYALPRGSIGARYTRRLEQGEKRDEISVSRRFDLPGEDVLALQLGYATFDGDDAVTAGLDWTRRGARGDLTVSLDRTVGSSLDDGFSTRTRISADYRRRLTPLTGLGIRAEFGRIDEEEGETNEAALLRASLNRQLTRDWTLSGGIEGAFEDDETETAVFARISRRFDLRP